GAGPEAAERVRVTVARRVIGERSALSVALTRRGWIRRAQREPLRSALTTAAAGNSVVRLGDHPIGRAVNVDRRLLGSPLIRHPRQDPGLIVEVILGVGGVRFTGRVAGRRPAARGLM